MLPTLHPNAISFIIVSSKKKNVNTKFMKLRMSISVGGASWNWRKGNNRVMTAQEKKKKKGERHNTRVKWCQTFGTRLDVRRELIHCRQTWGGQLASDGLSWAEKCETRRVETMSQSFSVTFEQSPWPAYWPRRCRCAELRSGYIFVFLRVQELNNQTHVKMKCDIFQNIWGWGDWL